MKNKDERFVRRRWAFPVLVVSVLVVVVTVVQVYGLKDEGNFYLQDVSGDRVVLDEIELSGSLRDGYHRMDFVIRGGKAVTSTKVNELPSLYESAFRYSSSRVEDERPILVWKDRVSIRPHGNNSGKTAKSLRFYESELFTEASAHGSSYFTFLDPGGDVLTVEYVLAQTPSLERIFYTFQLEPEVALLNKTKAVLAESWQLREDLTLVKYKDGKLFVVEVLNENRDESPNPFVAPQHLYLSVYEEDELIYQGALVTDQNDDLINGINKRGVWGYAYGPRDFRQFSNLELK